MLTAYDAIDYITKAGQQAILYNLISCEAEPASSPLSTYGSLSINGKRGSLFHVRYIYESKVCELYFYERQDYGKTKQLFIGSFTVPSLINFLKDITFDD